MRRGARARDGAPFGACVHTTGSGITSRFRDREGRAPTEREALDEYADHYLRAPRDGGYPNYLIGTDGTLAQIVPDDEVANHVGGRQRQKYLSGTWTLPGLCPSCRDRNLPDAAHLAAVSAWRERWRGYASPAHLYPDASANDAYIGVELVPIIGVSGATAAGPHETFTDAQYSALASLLVDLAVDHGWPDDWRDTSRLLGHEDVGILDRHDSAGGWDPGALRPTPRFRWERVGKTVWGRRN